jgi:hypothetical protein
VCALAEVAWTQSGRRSWSDFSRRLTQRTGGAYSHFDRLDAMGIGYRAAEPEKPAAAPLRKPAVTFTSSLTAREKEPFSRVAGYSGAARTTAAHVEGDWFLWSFAAPLTASRIDLKTGYDHLQRAGVPHGIVEISYDGKTFEYAGRIHDLKWGDRPRAGCQIHAIRVICESHGNGESFTLIQPLKIR